MSETKESIDYTYYQYESTPIKQKTTARIESLPQSIEPSIGMRSVLKNMNVGPKFGVSKAHALLQLLRDPSDPKRERYFSHIKGSAQTILYAGDSNPDAAGFRAGRLAQLFTKGKRQAVGVWVMSPNSESQDKAKKQCDVSVKSISENGQMLTKIADIYDQIKTEE